ncbi:MAG: c-type cytochrome [Chitinophagaceae bacterium]
MIKSLSPKLNLLVVLLSLISISACNTGGNITFADDIAPIIHQNCTPCHQTNGGAPFNLISFQDVAKRAKMIALVTSNRYMPPWPADKNYSHFINEKSLSDEQIKTIKLWFENGCKPGDTASLQLPVLNNFTSVLGKPDMILNVRHVVVKGDNKDKFYVLKMPYQIPNAKFVKAVEFMPAQLKYAHHVNGHYLSFTNETNPFSGSDLLDIESENYDEEFKNMNLFNHDGSAPFRVHSAFNYLPGAFGVRYPAGIGGFLMSPKGAFVANDIHYGPSRESVTDSSKLFIYFADKAPERSTFEIMMGTNGVSEIVPPLQVPAGKITNHISKLTIYNDISVLTVNPHMHLIGKKFKAYAVKPNGDTVKLISIPKWQFRWQYFYTFQYPVKIPKGSTIIVEAQFDNTASNPNNPNLPPLPIGERLDRGGASMRTADEMLQFIITYMPYQKGDESIDLSKP